jgi:hypothetical protein
MANFAWALQQLQSGKAVRRYDWQFLDKSSAYIKEVSFKGFKPCLVQYNKFSDGAMDKYPGAILDYDELIAGDWELAE